MKKKAEIDIVKPVEKLVLQLFASGMSIKSMEAIANIQHLCNQHLDGAFELEVIDIYKNPHAAEQNNIVFSPSLVRQSPGPKKVVVGTFADTNEIIKALGIVLKK